MPTKRIDRETRRRIARMEARRVLAAAQVRRRRRDNLFAGLAGVLALVLAVALQAFWFSNDPAPDDLALIRDQQERDARTAAGVPDPDTARGRVFTGTLDLNVGELGVELDGNAAPQAVAVFKQLADDGTLAGRSCHRLTATPDMGVLQCGSEDGKGGGDPDFQWGPIENAPADGVYPAGTIAVARGGTPDSHGTQFFITYKESRITQDGGGYTIMGKVTSGLDVLESVAAGGIEADQQDGRPKTAVAIDSFTLN
ncbi:putative peptidyl-prolyl cis-trans isomerase [Arthrobacter saudimassiliensis]|uniref:Putative peptidyl-prolyl cis-trans isomerase n=1 Tax=Arthrobacter saudimassiliensis TaxID=1461584 RepID=A0A078MTV4_9MICC|nr:putative peptidyl-prolyl cis-trans isomerase [Arthrobacter saudimassiliensis]